MENQQYKLPPVDRALEDFILAFDIQNLKSQNQKIEEELINKIDPCCVVDKIEDILKEKAKKKINPSFKQEKYTYKILKTELTKNQLYELKCQYPETCLIWIYDKHPIKRSKSQEHIDDEDINILKYFDIFIDPYKKVRGEKGKVYEQEHLPQIKKHCTEQLKKFLKQLKDYIKNTKLTKDKLVKDDRYMYVAYKESQKSIELRRWVGAVIIDENEKIISKGYNQYPLENATGSLSSNDRKNEVVHAEVDAILNIIKERESLSEESILCLYTTTFPCEDCAKCIIKAGIKKVIYIEPYHKSKTEDFYTSFITLKQESGQLEYLTFEGIGPRLFLYWNVPCCTKI